MNNRYVMLILLPFIIFSFLYLPFFNAIPYLDGDYEFIIAVNFFQGKYLSHWISYHPPLKLILSSFLFQLFGVQSYTLLGYLLGLLGILAMYHISKDMFDKKIALLTSTLLAASGLYISTGLFSVNDFLETIFILLSFMYLVKNRQLLYPLMASLAVLTKETAIIFPFSIILVELRQKKFNFYNLLPFITLIAWAIFLHLTGHSMWNSWNFSPSSKHGSFYTILYNLVTGSLFNKYAYENWLHLFIFNFNWFFWILALIACVTTKRTVHFYTILVFTILYTLIILSFPTFTINRYVLPILPFVYLYASVFLISNRFSYILIPITLFILGLSLFTSVDPISNKIWPKRTLLTEQFYSKDMDGNDGITYNMQFLFLTQQRDKILKSGSCKPYQASLNIDNQTLTLYHLPLCM